MIVIIIWILRTIEEQQEDEWQQQQEFAQTVFWCKRESTDPKMRIIF